MTGKIALPLRAVMPQDAPADALEEKGTEDSIGWVAVLDAGGKFVGYCPDEMGRALVEEMGGSERAA